MENFIGINVIGHISGNLGLAVAARNIISCLIKKGVQIRILNIDPGMGRDNFDTSFNQLFVQSLDQLIFPVNLFLFPPTNYTNELMQHFKNKFNVAFSYWELPHLPELLKDNLSQLDAIVAPSSYIYETFGREINNKHIIKGKTPYKFDFSKIERKEKNKCFKVFTSFEPHSDLIRKNPHVAIQCFQKAYAGIENVELTVKINNPYLENTLEINPLVSNLISQCSNDHRIIFDFNTYAHDELMKYFINFDLAVSLHRAEGFGLMPLEMMALGVPVIATNWSGNTDYMNSSNSFLVRHEMIDVNGTLAVYQNHNYKNGTVWADPNLDDAINFMKIAFFNDTSHISDNARNSALNYINEANEIRFVDEIYSIYNIKLMSNSNN
jgi:glycosyltransferase involved in cell wall biosynthesis